MILSTDFQSLITDQREKKRIKKKGTRKKNKWGLVAAKWAYRTYHVNKPKSQDFLLFKDNTKFEYENIIFIYVYLGTTKIPHSHVVLCGRQRSKTYLHRENIKKKQTQKGTHWEWEKVKESKIERGRGGKEHRS